MIVRKDAAVFWRKCFLQIFVLDETMITFLHKPFNCIW